MENEFQNANQALELKVKKEYAPFVMKGGLLENKDYYIYQTVPSFQPDLLIIGINPGGDKEGSGGWLTQGVNSYVVGKYPWFARLRSIFDYPNDKELAPILENCVGTNKCFINTGNVGKLPKEINSVATPLIRELVGIVQPKHILTLGADVFRCMKNKPQVSTPFGSINFQTTKWNDIPVAYVPNPSQRNQAYFTSQRVDEWHQALRWFLLDNK